MSAAVWLVRDGAIVAGPLAIDDLGTYTPPPGHVAVPRQGGESLGWSWDGSAFAAPPDARELGATQAAALDEIEELHAARLAEGAAIGPAWPGVRGSLSTSSRTDWLGALVLAQAGVLPLPHTVELLDGATVVLGSVGEIGTALGGLLGAYLALDGARVQARASVRVATTPAEVDAALAAYRGGP